MRETLSLTQVKNWLKIFSVSIITISDELNLLDSATGDGEHGSNLSVGAHSILEYVELVPVETIGQFFEGVGMIIVNSVGGASGALYGTLFLRLGKVSGDKTEMDLQLLSESFNYARSGISELGRVKAGDKTLFDALNPAVEIFLSGASSGKSLRAAISEARIAADQGRAGTAIMEARIGRGSYQQQRSIGHIDPGATSMAKLFEALDATVPKFEY